jgi:hypothetical protein
MVFDFYKEIFIEGNKNEKVSKIEHLLKIGKNDYNSIISKDKKYPFVVIPKSKAEKNKEVSEDKIVEKRDKILNEQKILERRIAEAINKKQDEKPIKQLKIFSFFYFIIMLVLCGVYFFSILDFYSTLKLLLNLVKNIVQIKYCDRITAFYIGESSLLHYKMNRIIGGTFYNYPADPNNKEGYIALIRAKIKESFLVNQEALQSLLSSKLKLSKNTTKYLNEIILNTEFIMKEDIYEKATPTYVVVRDPDSYYIEGVPHCKIFNLAPGETCLVGQHTIKRTSWAPYRFEVYVAGQQAPDLYYDTDKLYDYLMLEYPLI